MAAALNRGESDRETKRLLVVGRRRLYLQALCEYLVAKGVTASLAIDASQSSSVDAPDMVLIDCPSGAEAASGQVAEIAQRLPDARFLLLVPSTSARERSRDLGALNVLGCVSAHHGHAELMRWLAGPRARGGIQGSRSVGAPQSTVLSSLSGRETSVLELMVGGYSTEEIAGKLGISPHTVRTHVQNVMAKLGARSRIEMINIGRRSGVKSARLGAPS